MVLVYGYRPIGQTLRPLIDSLSEGARGVTFGQNASNGLRDYEPQQSSRQRAESPDFVELNTAIDEVRLAKVHSAYYWDCFLCLKDILLYESKIKYEKLLNIIRNIIHTAHFCYTFESWLCYPLVQVF